VPFIHFGSCPYWTEPRDGCTCPRPYRIRRLRTPQTRRDLRYPWVIESCENDGTYTRFMSASCFRSAVLLVDQMIKYGITRVEDL